MSELRRILKWVGLFVCGAMFVVYGLWPWTPPGLVAFHILAVPVTAYLWLRDTRPRARRVIKRGGTATVAIALLAWVFSLVWFFSCHGAGWSASLCAGRVQLEFGHPPPENICFRVNRAANSPQEMLALLWFGLVKVSLIYEGFAPSGYPLKIYSFPLWAILAVVIPSTGYLWWLDRRRPKPGHCKTCGYNLTGAQHERCPECGSPCEPEDHGT